jgi:MATE family multidrug resistance protein
MVQVCSSDGIPKEVHANSCTHLRFNRDSWSLSTVPTQTPTTQRPMTLRSEFKTLGKLASPVVAAQVGTMMLGVVDMMMLGQYSTKDLAASAIARVWIVGTVMIAQGILFGMDPRISQEYGAGQTTKLGTTLQAGFVLSLLLWIPLAIAWMYTGDMLQLMGVDPELSSLAGRYVLVQIPGIPFLLGYCALRSWLQGRGIMRPAMWVVLIANGLNVVINWALIFGHLGFESHGIVGAGYATMTTQIFMFGALLFLIRGFKLHKDAWTRWSHSLWPEIRIILSYGIPIGIHFAFEIWAFQIATLMAEDMGIDQLASHSVVLNLASITFMVPLGISIAASTRVGNLIGAGKFPTAQVATTAALLMGGGVMALSAIAFVMFQEQLPTLFTVDPAVALGATLVLPVVATFQMFDGVQAVAGGVLRGMGRTGILAFAHLLAFYLLGLPVAYYLCFVHDMGLAGIWWGLCIGLGAVAICLSIFVLRRGPGTMASRP